MELALSNGRVLIDRKLVNANIGIKHGKIVEIRKAKISAWQEINCEGKIVLPGVIDAHVHFRVPGSEEKEDWTSGSRAAAAGGVTTVLDMPNNTPSITTVKRLEDKRKIVEGKSLVNYGFHFGAGDYNIDEIMKVQNVAAVKVYMAGSTAASGLKDLKTFRNVLSAAKRNKKIVAVHAEDREILGKNIHKAKYKGLSDARYHAEIRSKDAAVTAVRNALRLHDICIGSRLHVCHVSSRGELGLIENSEKENRKLISCEVSPNHLFLNQEDVLKLGNFGKVNPPLRTKSDTAALWKGIKDGSVDCVATDHAPHLTGEKERNYWDAPAGIPGVETMLPLMLNAVNDGKIDLEQVARVCCENPARIFGIRDKGMVAKGYDADLTVIDMKLEKKVDNDELFSKCGWSPYNGMKLKGVVCKTIVNGNLVFDGGKITGKAEGKEVEFLQ